MPKHPQKGPVANVYKLCTICTQMREQTIAVTIRLKSSVLAAVMDICQEYGASRSEVCADLVADGLRSKDDTATRLREAEAAENAGRETAQRTKDAEREARTKPARRRAVGARARVAEVPKVPEIGQHAPTPGELTAAPAEDRFRKCDHGGNVYTCERVKCKIATGRA